MSPESQLGCVALLCWLPLLGCSSSLSKPPTGPVPKNVGVEVPYPPPAGMVETIPHRKSDAEIWIDGQWSWSGKEWTWTPGAWTVPPANAYFTPWTTSRRGDGRLYFERAAWRSKDGKRLDGGTSGDACPVDAGPKP